MPVGTSESGSWPRHKIVTIKMISRVNDLLTKCWIQITAAQGVTSTGQLFEKTEFSGAKIVQKKTRQNAGF